jgi:GT2 family glycosyltransferase
VSAHPTCSVIVPTYRRPQALRRCVEAIAGQAYPATRLELVVADDGEDDGLPDLLAPFRGRVELTLVRSGRRGPAAARNAAAAVAGGELLAFTDDDCEPDPGWLAALASPRDGAPVAVGGRTLNGLPRNPRSRFSQLVISAGYAHNNVDPDDARFLTSNNIAVTRDAYTAVGGFDERFRTSEDRDLCDRLVLAAGCLAYDERAVVWHYHEMTLRDFWQQQHEYGRGARAYHVAYAARHGMRIPIRPSFYIGVAGRAWRTRTSWADGLHAAALFGVWGAATAVGYARGPLAATAS